MKWLFALAALVGAAALATAAYIVLNERDPVPGEVAACVRKAELPLARSSEGLGAVRADASVGRLTVTQRWDWGRTNGVLLQGPARDYALLALWSADTPSLAGGDVGRRVYESPSKLPLVALEVPDRGRLRACAQKQG